MLCARAIIFILICVSEVSLARSTNEESQGRRSYFGVTDSYSEASQLSRSPFVETQDQRPLTLEVGYGYAPMVSLDLPKLIQLVESGSVNSVEQLLGVLKEKYPEFLKRYVLMYDSRSLQESSFEYPRVLMSDSSGRLIMSFNGHPTQRGYERLEVLGFDDQTHRFELRDIDFSGPRPVVSQANPKQCLQCHQSLRRMDVDPRPNWEPYDTWPGAYGSQNGQFPLPDAVAKKIPEDMKNQVLREEVMLERLERQIKPSHSRYSYLAPYNLEEPKKLTQKLAYLNAQRVMRMIETHFSELFALVDEAIFYSVRWRDPEPTRLGLKVYAESFKGVLDDTQIQRQANLHEKSHASLMGQFQLYFENMFGLHIDDWSMDFLTEGRFAFKERLGVPGNLEELYVLAYEDVTNDRHLSQLLGVRHVQPLVLKSEIRKSLKALEEIYPSLRKEIQQRQSQFMRDEPMPAIQRCITCHAEGEFDIPQIPFDQPMKLKARLSQASRSSGRTLYKEIMIRLAKEAPYSQSMPLGSQISESERESLQRYFEALRP